MLATLPPQPRSSPHSPDVPAYLRWRRPPCSSNSHAALVPPTRGGNFHPSAPVHPHALSVLAAGDAYAVSAPGSIALRTTSSFCGLQASVPILLGLFHAVTRDVQFQDHAVMYQTIDRRRRGHRILEDSVPFREQ